MKLRIDYDRCQGHWVCVSEAPEVFRADESTGQVVLIDGEPHEDLRAKVALAVKYCPTKAIAFVADSETEST